MALTWGLAIVTYQRSDMLARCVGLALAQTRPPAEVVVVDAGDDWAASARNIHALVEQHDRHIPCIYEPAEKRQVTAQRNQAARLSRADVLFTIDDDTLMYRCCAQRIMAVYDCDTQNTVAAVTAKLAADVPDRSPGLPAEVGRRRPRGRRRNRWHRRIAIATRGSFYPAAAGQPTFPMPRCAVPVGRVQSMTGAAMTVRRRVAETCGWDEALVLCPHEDRDAGWRFGCHGLLLQVGQRLFHHAAAPRPAGYHRRGALYQAAGLLNYAYVWRKLCGDDPSAIAHVRRYARGTQRFALVMGLGAARLDQWRGACLAQDGVGAILAAPPADLVQTLGEQTARVQAALR